MLRLKPALLTNLRWWVVSLVRVTLVVVCGVAGVINVDVFDIKWNEHTPHTESIPSNLSHSNQKSIDVNQAQMAHAAKQKKPNDTQKLSILMPFHFNPCCIMPEINNFLWWRWRSQRRLRPFLVTDTDAVQWPFTIAQPYVTAHACDRIHFAWIYAFILFLFLFSCYKKQKKYEKLQRKSFSLELHDKSCALINLSWHFLLNCAHSNKRAIRIVRLKILYDKR